jgi:predicted metal-dependent phosphoesterase TrpH
VVGLMVDPHAPALVDGLRRIRAGRDERARRIASSLAEAGISGAYEGAMRFVTSGQRILSRTHFARFLVETGRVRSVRDVFRRYLSPGKPGYVRHQWAALSEAVDWIHAAGGQAVLAHPGRCRLSRSALAELLAEFRDAGGDGIEVHSASHTRDQFAEFAGHARRFGFLASSGSDFHGPGESWLDLGALPPLPADLAPVWSAW